MATEQYSIGYEEGYQAGWNAVMDSLQPAQQEPAGSVYRYGKDSSGTPWHGIRWTASGLDLPDGTLIYTSPPAQRTWVGLTDEERDAMIGVTDLSGTYYYDDLYAVILAAEGKLAEKNT